MGGGENDQHWLCARRRTVLWGIQGILWGNLRWPGCSWECTTEQCSPLSRGSHPKGCEFFSKTRPWVHVPRDNWCRSDSQRRGNELRHAFYGWSLESCLPGWQSEGSKAAWSDFVPCAKDCLSDDRSLFVCIQEHVEEPWDEESDRMPQCQCRCLCRTSSPSGICQAFACTCPKRLLQCHQWPSSVHSSSQVPFAKKRHTFRAAVCLLSRSEELTTCFKRLWAMQWTKVFLRTFRRNSERSMKEFKKDCAVSGMAPFARIFQHCSGYSSKTWWTRRSSHQSQSRILHLHVGSLCQKTRIVGQKKWAKTICLEWWLFPLLSLDRNSQRLRYYAALPDCLAASTPLSTNTAMRQAPVRSVMLSTCHQLLTTLLCPMQSCDIICSGTQMANLWFDWNLLFTIQGGNRKISTL